MTKIIALAAAAAGLVFAAASDAEAQLRVSNNPLAEFAPCPGDPNSPDGTWYQVFDGVWVCNSDADADAFGSNDNELEGTFMGPVRKRFGTTDNELDGTVMSRSPARFGTTDTEVEGT